MDPLIGRVIDGYKIEAPLGEGGMASVYRATRGGESYALKFIHPALAKDQITRKRLEREAEVINQVQSAGVAAVYDVRIDSPTPYVVMELIEGITIEKDVEENGPWDLEDLCDLAKWLYNILEELHGSGVLHRDISPSNIMISQAGPVLIDFGLAQSLGQERFTTTGMVAGKPDYISPQLYRGEAPSPADDWWAWLGVLLFALTGKAPFGKGRLEAKMARVLQGDPEVDTLDQHLTLLFRAGFSVAISARPQPVEIVDYLEKIRDQKLPDQSFYYSGTVTPAPGALVAEPSWDSALRENLRAKQNNDLIAKVGNPAAVNSYESELYPRQELFPGSYSDPDSVNGTFLPPSSLETDRPSRLRLRERKLAKETKVKSRKIRRKIGRFSWFMFWISVVLLGGDWVLPQLNYTDTAYYNLALAWHGLTAPWVGATLIVLLLRIRYAN